MGIAALAMTARQAADPLLGQSYPFGIAILAILVCSSIFSGYTGILVTLASAVVGAYRYMTPIGSLAIASAKDVFGLLIFLLIGLTSSLIIETLHHSMARHRESERSRGLLLHEFRHRTRNDLQSLVGLLLLRARSAPNAETRAGLREAADHAMALARVHTRLERAGVGDSRELVVDTRELICGLVEDLKRWNNGDGLRPVAFIVDPEAHLIGTERAVQLGLTINELVTNSLKYAFPEDRTGTIRIRFWREGDTYRLSVDDDGIGLSGNAAPRSPPSSPPPPPPPAKVFHAAGSGLGTRLLRALASQLRGKIERSENPDGGGVHALLSFPCDAPERRVPSGSTDSETRLPMPWWQRLPWLPGGGSAIRR